MEGDAGGSRGIAAGPKGSVLAERYARGELRAPPAAAAAAATGRGAPQPPPRFPTNEEVVKALQERVETTVDLCRNYRHAAWYMLFVALYMVVLYFQASSFHAAEVVSTLKRELLEDPAVNTLAFASGDQVLAYLGNHVLRPIWTDPVCGDGRCEPPWEFPAWGPFGCRADCGRQPNVSPVIVAVTGNFLGHASLSPRTLMAAVRWNLCLADPARRRRGGADLCWFETDQTFSQYQETQIQSVTLVPGTWYVRVLGDYAGRVSGSVHDAVNETNPTPMATQPVWDSCLTRRSSPAATDGSTTNDSAAASTARRLQEAIGRLRSAAGEERARGLLESALLEAVSNSGGGSGSSSGVAVAG
ncbi:hypothetical protein Rsub_00529 [Raphidocelis subcapitata]|uniref:Uncharacterized protein n=1 Tax=Raphidocelis subcapitata TaxID=307507 RepID=A0A2V0NKI1_9CHLO|nr:hypothetical protein Rsub_00529 [Raphidocelis subcapitata]|eukprot:GBF87818.1 hypothetical protein Rsub_00529 [Raphidocelis subcapitata]